VSKDGEVRPHHLPTKSIELSENEFSLEDGKRQFYQRIAKPLVIFKNEISHRK